MAISNCLFSPTSENPFYNTFTRYEKIPIQYHSPNFPIANHFVHQSTKHGTSL